LAGKKIEYLDLALHLPPSTVNNIQAWLEKFTEDYDYMIMAPRLKEGLLKINSSDFIEFLGFWDPSALSDFESKKIKSAARDQMKRLLNKAVSSDIRYHYNWCLTALTNFKEGRRRQSS